MEDVEFPESKLLDSNSFDESAFLALIDHAPVSLETQYVELRSDNNTYLIENTLDLRRNIF